MSIESLAAQLKDIFGDRLRMVAAFGDKSSTCAVVQSLTITDLDRCAGHAAAWNKAGVDTPLLIVEGDLRRALDAFPLELSEIISTRRIVAGSDLFDEVVVPKQDLRRACEVQARGHVMHLREAYIEAAADTKQITALVAAAAPPFRALVKNAARLDGIAPKALVTQLSLDNFEKGFPEALRAAERVVDYVDRWTH
ncbi:MAG TPA: hypothetical protein VM115_05330 [Vicinamibacterales bacterium]|nr:hypothetical protein [Vicinamibacterales bacterium]